MKTVAKKARVGMATSAKYFVIVTPSFNQAHFIGQTIASIVSQENDLFSYWVIDGKSTDDTTKIVKKAGTKLQWVSEKDAGQTDALNKGIAKLRADIRAAKVDPESLYFAYINSDDYYLPGVFAKVAQAFAAHPDKQWLVGDCEIVDEKNKAIHQPIRAYKKFLRVLYAPWMLAILNPIPQPAVFVRWSAVEKIGNFTTALRYTMDYEYWLRLQKQFGAPILIPEALAAFRIHGASKGSSAFIEQFREQYAVVQRFTKNGLLLFLHRLHNGLITTVYKAVK